MLSRNGSTDRFSVRTFRMVFSCRSLERCRLLLVLVQQLSVPRLSRVYTFVPGGLYLSYT